LFDPRVTAGHRGVQAGLVEEDQAVRRYVPDRPPEGGSLGDDVGPELLERMKTFFFTTYPARYSVRLMLETWRRCFPRRRRLYSAVISPAFASGRRTRISSSSSRVTSERTPPPFLRGATVPSRRKRHTQRLAVASPTENRRARRMYPASPRSYAST